MVASPGKTTPLIQTCNVGGNKASFCAAFTVSYLCVKLNCVRFVCVNTHSLGKGMGCSRLARAGLQSS